MDKQVKDVLREIGQKLDHGIFPKVTNGGIVLPSETAILSETLGKETKNVGSRQEAPRKRAFGARGAFDEPQRPAARQGASSSTSPVVNSVTGSTYAEALNDVAEAYPGMQVWEQEGGFWLCTESGLLPGLTRPVSFLTGVSTVKRVVRSWAFYCSTIGVEWVGPRHTNFPDGSICAYDVNDGTWKYGESLVKLLDIYTVWALRQLYYQTFGLWPGPQAVPFVYERILEFEDDELCGCGKSGIRYVDCCKNADLNSNLMREAIRFGEFTLWSIRKPPVQIAQFICCRNHPPSISTLI